MWHGRRVIVAGGTAGFGLVLARHLARAGGRVLLVGRSSDGVRRALEACEREGGAAAAARGLAADLERAGEGERVVAEGLRLLGGVDDLFFCVGRSGRAATLQANHPRRGTRRSHAPSVQKATFRSQPAQRPTAPLATM
jgi:NAD(P)-dependent dehydrogenase (short-subunit alcohol dehydrogenase family)